MAAMPTADRPPKPANDACVATKYSRAHLTDSRRNDDARRATVPAASTLHRLSAADDVAGHHCRGAVRQDNGTAGPHAALQAARVHATCQMMHQMQFCSFSQVWLKWCRNRCG